MTYVELQVATHFSFLRGVSSAEELFAAARSLGYSGARRRPTATRSAGWSRRFGPSGRWAASASSPAAGSI